MKLITKNINGYNITMLDDTADSAIESLTKSPLKNASVESEELSSWARLQKLYERLPDYESPQKSASTEEPQLSSWARLYQLRDHS